MKKTFLILIASSILLASCSKSDTPSTPTGGGGSNSQLATLTCKIDGRTFTSTQAFGIYTENSSGGNIVKSVSFGHNAATSDETLTLVFGSMVTVGQTHTFSKASSSSSPDHAAYRKANTPSSNEIYSASLLASSPKSRFTYKVIRIFDHPTSVLGKAVEYDFSGVLYKLNNANDSVVITDGTLRY